VILNKQRGFETMVMLFENLCKLSCKDQNQNELKPQLVKSKVITLEIILKILESPSSIFALNIKILYILKGCLCEAIMKNSFSNERSVFTLAFSIFSFLVEKYREHLKTEIAALVETVFLKILDSSNSSFNHLNYSLFVLSKVFCDARCCLEFYVNYDCTEDNPLLVQKIIGSKNFYVLKI